MLRSENLSKVDDFAEVLCRGKLGDLRFCILPRLSIRNIRFLAVERVACDASGAGGLSRQLHAGNGFMSTGVVA